MGITNGTHGLASTFVIIVLIFPEIAAHTVFLRDSAPDNVSEPIRKHNNTIRADPLDNLKKYRGGFNITNKHYWSSVVFTGVYGYAIGVLWLLCGIVYGVFLVATNFCCLSDRENRTRKIFPCNCKGCGLSPIPLAILLTILAMAASGFVLAGSSKFHSQARTSLDIIINTANVASETIHNATGALRDIQGDLVESSVNVDESGKLNSTIESFDATAENIVKRARKNRRLINKVFKVVFVITIVIISLNLVAVIASTVSGVLKLRRVLYLLVILCWLMTVICWLLLGVYFFLENFSDDVCTALNNFQENPYNNSLSSIVPCDELLSAESVLSEISAGIYNLVNKVNANISNRQGKLLPNLVYICNPFSGPPEYTYQPENCSANTIQIGDVPKVLEPYTCFDDESCGNGDFLTGSEYELVKAYTSSIQKLLDVYPRTEHLLGCQLVKDAFSQILQKHCKPLKKFSRMTWIGLVVLGSIMVFTVVLWTVNTFH
ncbi:PREDICTED: uncharacterized protein LOC109351531 isoform X2 [Lupinus angustifolius]|nr:PREDICTED: uncharacterized protein LOC109351531 isoform X2 [Lupinus angustifolius]